MALRATFNLLLFVGVWLGGCGFRHGKHSPTFLRLDMAASFMTTKKMNTQSRRARVVMGIGLTLCVLVVVLISNINISGVPIPLLLAACGVPVGVIVMALVIQNRYEVSDMPVDTDTSPKGRLSRTATRMILGAVPVLTIAILFMVFDDLSNAVMFYLVLLCAMSLQCILFGMSMLASPDYHISGQAWKDIEATEPNTCMPSYPCYENCWMGDD